MKFSLCMMISLSALLLSAGAGCSELSESGAGWVLRLSLELTDDGGRLGGYPQSSSLCMQGKNGPSEYSGVLEDRTGSKRIGVAIDTSPMDEPSAVER